MEDTHLNQLRDNLEVLSSVTTTMQSIINNSQLAGYFEEGIQKLVSGIELLVEKVEAMKNFNLLKDKCNIHQEEGFFGLLPFEIKLHIFSYLELRDFVFLSTICKQWRDYVMNDTRVDLHWRDLFYKDFMQSRTANDGVLEALGGPCGVKVTTSAIWTGTPEGFLSKDQTFCWTTNHPFSWFCVDVGEGVAVVPHAYTFKYASSGNACCPRNWLLQGANELTDNDHGEYQGKDPTKDLNWDTLSVHEDDTTINTDFAEGYWNIDLKEDKAYRYFRLIQTGPNAYPRSPNAPDDWSNVLVASGFEIFGKIILNPEGENAFAFKPQERSWRWLYMCKKNKFLPESKKEGPGSFETDEYRYVGDWKNNMKDGFGLWVHKNGSQYRGWWKNDRRHGYGVLVCEAENGGKVMYKGEWDRGVKQGKGTFIWETYGDYYTGEWYEDKKHGLGKFEWVEGDTHEGYWHQDMLDGHGVFTAIDGNKYEGEFKEDELLGPGTLTLIQNNEITKYTGNFKGSFTWRKREGIAVLLNQLKRYALKNEKLFKKVVQPLPGMENNKS